VLGRAVKAHCEGAINTMYSSITLQTSTTARITCTDHTADQSLIL
jgi:hypothetical protein